MTLHRLQIALLAVLLVPSGAMPAQTVGSYLVTESQASRFSPVLQECAAATGEMRQALALKPADGTVVLSRRLNEAIERLVQLQLTAQAGGSWAALSAHHTILDRQLTALLADLCRQYPFDIHLTAATARLEAAFQHLRGVLIPKSPPGNAGGLERDVIALRLAVNRLKQDLRQEFTAGDALGWSAVTVGLDRLAECAEVLQHAAQLGTAPAQLQRKFAEVERAWEVLRAMAALLPGSPISQRGSANGVETHLQMVRLALK